MACNSPACRQGWGQTSTRAGYQLFVAGSRLFIRCGPPTRRALASLSVIYDERVARAPPARWKSERPRYKKAWSASRVLTRCLSGATRLLRCLRAVRSCLACRLRAVLAWLYISPRDAVVDRSIRGISPYLTYHPRRPATPVEWSR